MAKYRKLVYRFWTDPRVYEMSPTQKLLFNYVITGPEACTIVNLSGIYEIHRGALAMRLNLPVEQVEEDLQYFNREKPMLLEYDSKRHMLFVKSFCKYNSHYKSSVLGLMEDFNNTFHKAPEFWAEFGQIYRQDLGKVYPILENEECRNFLDRLFELKNEILDPKPDPKSSSAKKIVTNEKTQNL